MNAIDFVIPVFNAAASLERTVSSILAQEYPCRANILIIDDGSTDGSLAVARGLAERFPSVKVFSKPNGGEASALNRGLAEVTGEFVALVEADVVIAPGWLGQIMAAFTEPGIAGAGGMLTTGKDEPWIARLAGYEIEGKLTKRGKFVAHLTTANAVYRASVMKEIGPFDERLINASLDTDYSVRVVRAGYKLVFVREAVAFHHYKSTFLEYLKRQYAYARYRAYVDSVVLYPADRMLAVNVLLAGIFLCSLTIFPLAPAIPGGLFALLVVLQLPATVELLLRTRDGAVLLYPFVLIIRNMVACVAAGIGYFRKLSTSPSASNNS